MSLQNCIKVWWGLFSKGGVRQSIGRTTMTLIPYTYVSTVKRQPASWVDKVSPKCIENGRQSHTVEMGPPREAATSKKGCLQSESNTWPSDLQSDALPTELWRRAGQFTVCVKNKCGNMLKLDRLLWLKAMSMYRKVSALAR